MRIDPIIDYAYGIEDQSQPGHESLRRSLVMAILLRDGANNTHEAELYAAAAHPCGLTQHVLIDLYLARNAISQLSASDVRPPGLTDETLIELKILGMPAQAGNSEHVRTLTRATHITDNMLALALWCTNTPQDVARLGETLGRRLSPSEPFRAALWATCTFDHAAAHGEDVAAAAAKVVARMAGLAPHWRAQLAQPEVPAATLAMWCRALDIAIDAAIAIGAQAFPELWTLRLQVAAQLEATAAATHGADVVLRFLQRARLADVAFARECALRPKTLQQGPFMPWRDHAAILVEKAWAADPQALGDTAARLTDPHALRRLALAAELAHQDYDVAKGIWRLARHHGLGPAASLIHELRLAYRTRDWAAMQQLYLAWAEQSQDATEAHAAWVGAAVAAMRQHDDSSALFCWAAAQDAAPSPIAAFGEKLLRQLHASVIKGASDETQLAHAGDAAMQQKQYAEAASWYRQLVAAHPGHPRYVRDLRRALESAGMWRELVALLDEEAARVDDQARVPLWQQAAAYCEERLRDASGAVARNRQILRHSSEASAQAGALEALARIYESTGAWAELVETTVEQVPHAKRAPDKALLWFRCGSVIEAKFGDLAAAEPYYRKALAASPACMPALHALRELYRARGDWQAVVDMLELEGAQWSEDADRASVYAQIGAVYRDDARDQPSALIAFRTALDIDPDCIAASLAMLDHYLAHQQWQAGREILERMDHTMVRHATRAEKANFACQCAKLALHDQQRDEATYWVGRALAIDSQCQQALELLIEIAERTPEPWALPEDIAQALVAPPDLATQVAPWRARRDLVLAWSAVHATNVTAAAALASAAQAHGTSDIFLAHALARLWQRLSAL